MAFWNKAYEWCHAKKEKLCAQRDYASQGLQVEIAELYFIFCAYMVILQQMSLTYGRISEV